MEAFQPYFSTSTSAKKSKGVRKQSGSPRGNSKATVKRTVKYLSVCHDPSTYRNVVRSASDPVIKTICNAALNVERGDIRLTQAQKKLFRQHRARIAKLTSRTVGLPAKRRLLEQRGSGFFIPALIGAAITGLTSLFGSKKE